MKNKIEVRDLILKRNFNKDLEKILINIRDFKKKDKIKLVKAILRFAEITIKDKLEIVKFLIEE